jgi:hypothetical protein
LLQVARSQEQRVRSALPLEQSDGLRARPDESVSEPLLVLPLLRPPERQEALAPELEPSAQLLERAQPQWAAQQQGQPGLRALQLERPEPLV